MMQIVGTSYPSEIIMLIIMSSYEHIKISCGCRHTILLSDKIYVWGHNGSNQLGSNFKKHKSPTELIFHTKIKSISCGWTPHGPGTYE